HCRCLYVSIGDHRIVLSVVDGCARKRSCCGVFFFSSRRRHTRSTRDWKFRRVLFRSIVTPPPRAARGGGVTIPAIVCLRHQCGRSEERRVGKEHRSRWGGEHHESEKERVERERLIKTRS